jgi:hypothetical protein
VISDGGDPQNPSVSRYLVRASLSAMALLTEPFNYQPPLL